MLLNLSGQPPGEFWKLREKAATDKLFLWPDQEITQPLEGHTPPNQFQKPITMRQLSCCD